MHDIKFTTKVEVPIEFRVVKLCEMMEDLFPLTFQEKNLVVVLHWCAGVKLSIPSCYFDYCPYLHFLQPANKESALYMAQT